MLLLFGVVGCAKAHFPMAAATKHPRPQLDRTVVKGQTSASVYHFIAIRKHRSEWVLMYLQEFIR